MAAGGTDELNWDDLRYFLRAVQSKTLAGAARSLGVDHTTIGRRLSALERSLGATLVVRGPDGLQPTPLGERLAPLVEELERGVSALRALVNSEQTRVRLAVPSGFTALFVGRLAELREEQPQLSLELLSGSRPVDLKKGEADLALRVGPITDEDLVARKLGSSGWSLYASATYLARHPGPVDVQDLSGHEIIGYDASRAALPAAVWIEKHAAGATVVLRSREMTDVLSATASGAGLGVLPCVLGDADPGLTRLTPEVLARREISLVYRREALLAEHVRAVVAFVVAVMRDNADKISGEPKPTL